MKTIHYETTIQELEAQIDYLETKVERLEDSEQEYRAWVEYLRNYIHEHFHDA
jgi:chaperonin cofactor prefoldin